MNVFVIVCPESNALMECGVFLNQANAESHKSKNGIPKNAAVMELPVYGEIKHPGIVYVSSVRVPSSNVHFFSGIYGNSDLAATRAGEEGLVVRREIEGWWGAITTNITH